MISRFFGRPRTLRNVRVRYAPSPTGSLHLGGLRTALYNKLFAMQNNGSYVLRIEDTDRKRLVAGSKADIQNVFKWAGLEPDEGPDLQIATNNYGPYIQSERLSIYKQYLQRLKDAKAVYPCFCSSQRLDEVNSRQKKAKQPMLYDGHCRGMPSAASDALIQSGKPFTYRFRNNVTGLSFRDAIYECVSVEQEHLGDFILIKSDGWPTYHFANVVDDIEMKISHVIRGQQWLTSTPKHLLLYDALNQNPPEFVHLPLILSPSGGKLSKRDSSTAVQWYIDQGYEPEAVLNAVALLGWSPSDENQELLTMGQLAKEFNLFKVHKAPATLNLKKLDSLNKRFVKEKYKAESIDDKVRIERLRERLGSIAATASDGKLFLLGGIALDRVTRLPEVLTNFPYVFGKADFHSLESQRDFKQLFGCNAVELNWKIVPKPASGSASNMDKNKFILTEVKQILLNTPIVSEQSVKEALAKSHVLNQYSHEQVFHLTRYCLTGRSSGPGLEKIICLLSRQQVLSSLESWLC